MIQAAKAIRAPSIIAAIIKSGTTINKKTLKEFKRKSLKALNFSFSKTNIPSFNPKPNEINTAGNSKIP